VIVIREDIASMLRAGHPHLYIVRTLHVAPLTVQRTREALGLPKPKPGPRAAASYEEVFHRHTEPTEDGHVRWTGPSSGGTPAAWIGNAARSAYRIAFEIRHGRPPIGRVKATCGMPGCVAGDHVEDRPMREGTGSAFFSPSNRPGRPDTYASLEEAFLAHVQPLEGGHARWTGYANGSRKTPIVCFRRQRPTAYRVSFRLHYGRDPEGPVRSECGMGGCVAGAHLQDGRIRTANRQADAAYAAIFGDAA
jgi:hypothetical protein